MSHLVEQLAAAFESLAVKEMVQLPPALPPPKPPAAKPAAAPAAPSVTGAAPSAVATPAAAAALVAKPAVSPASVVGRGVPAESSVVSPAPAPATAAPKPVAPATAAAPAAPKPAPAPAAPPPPPKPIQLWKFEDKGIHFEATIESTKVVEAAQIMDRLGFAIDAVTGMDWPAQGLLEVIYDFLHFQDGTRAVFRARIARTNPEIATISKVFPGADWHERETHDFFGIKFAGHRDLSPFLLPDDSTYHPLLKDFKA